MTSSSSLHLTDSSSMSFRLHPVVVFAILDHFKRRNEGQRRVVGTLLGEVRGNQVYIKNSFPVPHTENEDAVGVDMEYHVTMLNLHKRVNPKEVVVGWYSTGDKIDYISSLIHQVYEKQAERPVHVTVDVSLTDFRMGVKAYTGSTIKLADQPVLARFDKVALDFHAYEAEKIGVDALIHGHPDDKKLDSPALLLSDFDNLQLSMGKLLEMLETVTTYVDKVVEGKIKGDVDIGRAISNALAAIPSLDSDSFNKMLNNQLQDLLMIVYLANLTRTQLALADKINGILQ